MEQEKELIKTKEQFLNALEEIVVHNIVRDIPFLTDLRQEQVDKIIKENNLNPAEAISWLFDSGLYLIDENHEGWFCPSIRQKFLEKHKKSF